MSTYGNIELNELSIEALRELADELGVKYHPSTGSEKLIAKIETVDVPESMTYEEFIALKAVESEKEPEPEVVAEPVKVETPGQRKARLKKEASALVRCRVTCMNPAKKEWHGEIFTVSNSVVGTFRKFVPFEEEWHVPSMMLQMIKDRMYQSFVTVKDGRGNSRREGRLVREFAVEVLPPLTEEELKDLAQQQAMAGGV